MNALRLIKYYWSKLSNLGVDTTDRLGKVRSIRLVNQLSLVIALVSISYIVLDNDIQPQGLLLIERFGFFLLISIPLINRAGYPMLARYVLYFWLNFFCTMMALVMGSASGMLMYFIPLMAGSALVFNLRRRVQTFVVLAMPLLMLGLIFYADDAFAINQELCADQLLQIFHRNFVLTMLFSFMLAGFYFQITYRQQKELIQALDAQALLNTRMKERDAVMKHNLAYTEELMQELKKRETYFSALTHQASDIIAVLDADGRLQYVSNSFQRLLGYAIESVLNTSVFDYIHPDDVTEAMNLFHKRMANGPERDILDLRCRRADGNYLYLEVKGNNLLDMPGVEGIVLNARNVTERVRYEKELKRSESNIRSILDHNDNSIWMVGRDLRLMEFNQQAGHEFKETFGLNMRLGMHILSELSEAEQKKWTRRYERAFQGEQPTCYDVYGYDETERAFRLSLFPVVNENGEIDRCTVFAKDITEQILSEQAIIDARDKAEEASLAKAQFLSTMSHEMRTPMNAIIGMTYLMLEEQPRPEQAENLRILKFSAENLLALINDILDFNKIEAGRIEFEQMPFNLSRFVLDLKKSFMPIAQEGNLQLEVLHDASLPEQVVGDSLRLGQVMTNLIGNALKFTEEGQVSVEIFLHSEDEEGYEIEFSVRDTGIGIAEDKQRLIFESFRQASSETTRRFGGTGLGLAICKRLLELQGSKIQLQSQPGEGSHFWFRLKFGRLDKVRQVPGKSRKARKKESISLEGRQLLLIEDSPLNVQVARKFLEKWGLKVWVAESGEQALQQLKKQTPELVLLDLHLPDMDGFELARRMQEESKLQVPILAISAAAESGWRERALAAGMKGYILKPFEPDTLYQAIVQALHSHELSV